MNDHTRHNSTGVVALLHSKSNVWQANCNILGYTGISSLDEKCYN